MLQTLAWEEDIASRGRNVNKVSEVESAWQVQGTVKFNMDESVGDFRMERGAF